MLFRTIVVPQPEDKLRTTACAVRFSTLFVKNLHSNFIMAIVMCGGRGGIRTLDGVAPIPPFQDGALDQLCDPSSSRASKNDKINLFILPARLKYSFLSNRNIASLAFHRCERRLASAIRAIAEEEDAPAALVDAIL